MQKNQLAELLGVDVKSLAKVMSRKGVQSLSDHQGLSTILQHYSTEFPGRSTEVVEKAKKLIQSNILIINNNDNRIMPPERQPEPLPQPKLQEVTIAPIQVIKKKPELSDLIASKTALVFLVIVGAVAIAVGITAPVFIAVAIPIPLSYTLAFFVDSSTFIFMYHGKKRYGVILAISTGIQAGLTVGAFDFIGQEITHAIKGFTVAACLAFAVHGLSAIISEKAA